MRKGAAGSSPEPAVRPSARNLSARTARVIPRVDTSVRRTRWMTRMGSRTESKWVVRSSGYSTWVRVCTRGTFAAMQSKMISASKA